MAMELAREVKSVGLMTQKIPERLEIIAGDVTDLGFISRLIADGNIDTVYHLAAININIGSGISPYTTRSISTAVGAPS